MKCLIDTNIILDVLQDRKPHVRHSSVIWKLCETKTIKGSVSALTFSNLVYIMRKELSPTAINEVFRKLNIIFTIEDLTKEDLTRASSLLWNDYEDAVQAATSERVGAEYIITRNKSDYKGSSVHAVSPEELIEIVS